MTTARSGTQGGWAGL